LDISYSNIADLSPLATLTNLTGLNLGYNYIADVSPLAGLTNLTTLELVGNSIVDVCPLVGTPGLDSLDIVYLEYNPLSSTSCTVCIPQLEGRGVDISHSCP
jgi:Leucine-rich repeat (LRR) protein